MTKISIDKNIFALYKGEICLAIGSVEEISKELNIKPETVKFYMTPSYKKRTSENAKRLVKL